MIETEEYSFENWIEKSTINPNNTNEEPKTQKIKKKKFFGSIFLAILDLMKKSPEKGWTGFEIKDELNRNYIGTVKGRTDIEFTILSVINSITVGKTSNRIKVKK